MTGTLWSVDLAWPTVVLAGTIGTILALEVDSGFRLARAISSYLVARARGCLTETMTEWECAFIPRP